MFWRLVIKVHVIINECHTRTSNARARENSRVPLTSWKRGLWPNCWVLILFNYALFCCRTALRKCPNHILWTADATYPLFIVRWHTIFRYLYVRSSTNDIRAMRYFVWYVALCMYLSYNGPVLLPVSLIVYKRTHVWT
jgi:hypothetical protein